MVDIQFENIQGFGLAISWLQCDQHDIAIIFLFWAVKIKWRKL